jgi:hypothetical protein
MRVDTVRVDQFLCVSWELYKTEKLNFFDIVTVYQYFKVRKLIFEKVEFFRTEELVHELQWGVEM